MTAEEQKPKKKQTTSQKAKPACGTLSYLADCRGTAHKSDISRSSAAPAGMNKIVRRYSEGLRAKSKQ